MKNKNANYSFKEQKVPKNPMGLGFFANMPKDPIQMSFGDEVYRDGVVDSFTAGLKNLSKISENQR